MEYNIKSFQFHIYNFSININLFTEFTSISLPYRFCLNLKDRAYLKGPVWFKEIKLFRWISGKRRQSVNFL